MRRQLLASTVLAMAVLLLAACGPAAPTPSPVTPTLVPSATPTTPLPTATPPPSGPVVQAPWSAPPVLDGTIDDAEWADALRVEMAGGDELWLMHDGSFLYLAIRTQGMPMGSLCLDRGDEVAILHASAALGTAVFRRDGDAWSQTRTFSWRCRGTDNSAEAVQERQAFLQDEGWLASNGYMGRPSDLEYQIAMPEGSLRLAVLYRGGANFDIAAGWPADLDDGCREFEQAEGDPQGPLSFSPEQWVTVQAAPPGGGRIAFVSTRDGNGEIYVMNADGSDPRRLTNYRLWDGFPDWSPDGAHIAYYSYLSDTHWVIRVMSADGSDSRQLTDSGVCDGAPHWSPDGAWITYDSGDCSGDHRDVYLVPAAGGEPRNLTNNPADDMLAAWSPDGTRLVFSSDRDGNYELYVMDADGGNVRRLTDDPAEDHAPAWSPDGAQIAFYSNRDGNAEIYVMDADGSSVRRLTENTANDWFPRWSPDGSQITFSSNRDGNLEIYVMNADGSDVRRLTDRWGDDFNSVWQP